jgi:hypothetical protein
LWRVPTSGGQPSKVTDGIFNRAFAVVTEGIYFMEVASGETRLQFFDLAARKTTTVARNVGDITFDYTLSVSSDGRVILYGRLDSSIDDLMLVEDFR